MKDHSKQNKIVRRILKELGTPDLIATLAERISLSDLQSLLLAVYQKRTASLSPKDLIKQYRSNRFVPISSISPIDANHFDLLAYSLLPEGFQPIELSPVSPLGTCSILGPVDQNNVITTIRNTEVCSDATNVLALESAIRRSKKDGRLDFRKIKLCTSHRLLRGQLFEGSVSFPHFRVLSLCTAGRSRGNFHYEAEAIVEHIEYYIRLLLESKRLGYKVQDIRVTLILLFPGIENIIEQKILHDLSARNRDITFNVDSSMNLSHGYYDDIRFQIYASNLSLTEYFLVDGGLTSWTQQLLNNRKEFFLISGMGTERFIFCFRHHDDTKKFARCSL
jgi:hypothetical protein